MYEHYRHADATRRDPDGLAKLVAASRERDRLEVEERERLSHENHLKVMAGFREWVKANDCFTDEEREQIIEASCKW